MRQKPGKKHRFAERQLEALELRGRSQEPVCLAQRRSFEPGFEVQDWLKTESELKANVESTVYKSLPKPERAQHRTYEQ